MHLPLGPLLADARIMLISWCSYCDSWQRITFSRNKMWDLCPAVTVELGIEECGGRETKTNFTYFTILLKGSPANWFYHKDILLDNCKSYDMLLCNTQHCFQVTSQLLLRCAEWCPSWLRRDYSSLKNTTHSKRIILHPSRVWLSNICLLLLHWKLNLSQYIPPMGAKTYHTKSTFYHYSNNCGRKGATC